MRIKLIHLFPVCLWKKIVQKLKKLLKHLLSNEKTYEFLCFFSIRLLKDLNKNITDIQFILHLLSNIVLYHSTKKSVEHLTHLKIIIPTSLASLCDIYISYFIDTSTRFFVYFSNVHTNKSTKNT